MKKIELLNVRNPYMSPYCKIFTVEPEGILCNSDWGDEDEAGTDIYEDEEYWYDL